MKRIILLVGRSVVVGVSYIMALVIVGAVMSALGFQVANDDRGARLLPALFIGGVVMGLVLGPLAQQLTITRTRQLGIWICIIFLNLVSVIIEGAFFAPTQVGGSLPILVAQQFLLAGFTAGMITLLFAPRDNKSIALPPRAWYDWLWRYLVSAASYLLFYFIFGAINYALVTRPYYESHAGGLTTPGVETVLVAESIRALLITLSVLPFLLTVAWPRGKRVLWTGIILFAIGGIVPLLYRVNALPLPLLLASGVEIFFQNFSTGLVAGFLLGRSRTPQNVEFSAWSRATDTA